MAASTTLAPTVAEAPASDPLAASVLTTGQAVRTFGRGHLRHQLARRRWQRPHRGVVVLHSGPLTHEQRLWIALLACPPGSALSGIDALGTEGLTGVAAAPRLQVAVTMPLGSRRPPRGLVRAHWSEQLDTQDVHLLRAPRRTRPARSAIDEASWADQDRWARVVLLATVQQRLTRPMDLYATLARRGSPSRRALILESIHDAGGGIQSLPEHDFDVVRRLFRVPEPSRQSRLRRRDGHFYLDVEWRTYGAACEVHGIPHSWVPQWDADLDRENEITLAGPRLLVFSSYAVRRRPTRVGDQLVRLLRRGGWTGA